MINTYPIAEVIQKLNKHVVGYYDSQIHGLSKELYRIDGIQYIGSHGEPLKLLLKPIDDDCGFAGNAFFATIHDVLTYEDIVEIHTATKTLFENSKEVFKGVFTRAIKPMRDDYKTLGILLEEYHKRGLVIEEVEKCATTNE